MTADTTVDFDQIAREAQERMAASFEASKAQAKSRVKKAAKEQAPEHEVQVKVKRAAEEQAVLDRSVQLVSWRQLRRSELNPRKHFDQEALRELALDIHAKGLLQNLVARPTEKAGLYEIAAGERRYRAIELLVEGFHRDGQEGGDNLVQVDEHFQVPVLIREMTDRQLIETATAENVARRNMTPLEEADAFHQLVKMGADVEELALRFGYNARTVRQRLALSNLSKPARKALEDGAINLSQAEVISSATGAMQKQLLERAQYSYGSTAAALRTLLKEGNFLVQHAAFDVAASSLEVVDSLFDDTPAYFVDSKAALNVQMRWLEAKAERLRKRRGHHFVDILAVDSASAHLPYGMGYREAHSYDRAELKPLRGTVLVVSTRTGEWAERQGYRIAELQAAEKAQQTEAAAARGEAPELVGARPIQKRAHQDGQQARARAVRTAVLGNTRLILSLSILNFLSAHSLTLRAPLSAEYAAPLSPSTLDRLQEIVAKVPGLSFREDAVFPVAIEGGWSSDVARREYRILTQLRALPEADLMDLLGTIVAQSVWRWTPYDPSRDVDEFNERLAADLGAVPALALTDAHLKAYPGPHLIDLMRQAGLKSDEVEANARLPTQKQQRSAFLEHAPRLAAEGWVPPVARFKGIAGLPPLDHVDPEDDFEEDEDGEEE